MIESLFGIGDLSPSDFTKRVAHLGIKIGRLSEPEVDCDRMRIKSGGDTLMLQNFYRQFLTLPRRERKRFITEVVLQPKPELPTSWEECAPYLIANVRGGQNIAIAAMQARLGGDSSGAYIAHKQIGPDLYATLAIDLPTMSVPVTTTMLARWGKTFDEAYENGFAKLATNAALLFASPYDGFWMGQACEGEDTTYVAARILLPQILEALCPNPYVSIPCRDKIFVGDPSKPETYALMVAMANNPNDSHRISSRVLQLVDGELREATPVADSGADILEELIDDDTDSAYAYEREVWDQLDTPNAFMAKYMRMRRPTGEIVRMTTWTQAVVGDTLLPEVDIVACVLGDPPLGPTFLVPFEALVAKCSLGRTESPLPRWTAPAEAYPSREWLEANALQPDEAN